MEESIELKKLDGEWPFKVNGNEEEAEVAFLNALCSGVVDPTIYILEQKPCEALEP